MVDYSAPCKMVCPACSGVLAVILSDEVTPVACECGNIFLAQHPDTRATMKKKPKKKEKPSPKLSLELLEQADDVTSAAVIAAFAKDPAFKALSKSEMEAILARDDEDDLKLAEGIKMAVAKGAVPSKVELEPLTKIDVYGKTADDVAAGRQERDRALDGQSRRDLRRRLQGEADLGAAVAVLRRVFGAGVRRQFQRPAGAVESVVVERGRPDRQLPFVAPRQQVLQRPLEFRSTDPSPSDAVFHVCHVTRSHCRSKNRISS